MQDCSQGLARINKVQGLLQHRSAEYFLLEGSALILRL